MAAVADLLSQHFGSGWDPVAALAYGDPRAEVTGIAVTWTPTLQVLRQAGAKRQNLILSLEPPFWNGPAPEGRSPGPDELASDRTYQAKRALLDQGRVNILYVRSGWTARNEDGQLRGLARALGWETHYRPRSGVPAWAPGNDRFVLPASSFGQLARNVRSALKADAIRCVGSPDISVSHVALTHGYFLVSDLQRVLQLDDVDVVVCGEACEWEAVPYFMDLIASGRPKAMILLGSQVSSEPGCGEMADWLRGLLDDVPVEWQPAGEPFSTVG